MTALMLNLDPVGHLTHEQFRELCRENRDLRLELTAKGELMVMPPTGWESGKRNADLMIDLGLWNRQVGLGVVFDSSTGFTLSNGAVRSPDAAWVALKRLTALTPNPEGFLPLAPDFLIELRSTNDRLKPLQDKMQEYIENGVRLGWLLNPKDRIVEIYRPGHEVNVLQSPIEISGEDVLPGFVLKLEGIWGS
ncbi:MAG: Uma2 family endonuclease [Thermosynechococcaceae cyanobacterium]